MSRILVIAAHRDDEVLGTGGLLAQTAGTEVMYLGEQWLCRAQGDLLTEMGKAHAVLPLTPVLHNTFFPDNRFDTVSLLSITQAVERAVEVVRPDIIYTHQPNDLNIDHRLTCQAVLTATRPYPGQTVKAVYGFEVPSSTEWAFGHPPFAPNVFVPLSGEAFEKKLAALRCYESELRAFPHPRSVEAVTALAQWRGAQCGHPLAEAFMLLREIRT